jgi:hypothetical protein
MLVGDDDTQKDSLVEEDSVHGHVGENASIADTRVEVPFEDDNDSSDSYEGRLRECGNFYNVCSPFLDASPLVHFSRSMGECTRADLHLLPEWTSRTEQAPTSRWRSCFSALMTTYKIHLWHFQTASTTIPPSTWQRGHWQHQLVLPRNPIYVQQKKIKQYTLGCWAPPAAITLPPRNLFCPSRMHRAYTTAASLFPRRTVVLR